MTETLLVPMSAALKTGQSQPSSLPAGKLPFELWKMVVDELGCTFRRNELLPLLCTSRFFHALVAPIFYETIALHGYALMSRAPAPATYANRRHPKRPCVGLHNPSLSQHTRSIFEICLSTDENVNVVSECFSHLTNLERLSLCSDEDEFTLLLGAIPLSAPLSHLSILPEYECSALGAFLTAHSSTLRFIKIQCGNSDNVVKLAFPSTLPHLHVFEGPSCIWEEVIKVAPIKHLATNDTLETIDVALAYDLFDNLTSFMFGLYQIDVMSPLLRNISALHISIDEDDGPEQQINIQSLMNIPSERLRYILFSRDKFMENFDSVVDALFRRYPSLGVIEFSGGESYAECQVYRYRRIIHGRRPAPFWRRAPGAFEPWFERIGKEFWIFCGEQ